MLGESNAIAIVREPVGATFVHTFCVVMTVASALEK
jgi:hypothetical protein